MSNLDWVEELKVVDLRKRLKELGENTSGKKSVLVERLKTALTETEEAEEQEQSAEDQPEVEQEETKKPEIEEDEMAVDEKEGGKTSMTADDKEAEMQTDEPEKEENEAKSVKGGLTELLGDGKDDLELDFETDKPVRKKQKLEDKEEKSTDPIDTATAEPTDPLEKKTQDADFVDFDASQRICSVSCCLLDVGLEEEGKQGHGEPEKAPSDVMEVETPVVPEEDRTCAIRIQNFVRPFTEKAAKEMLSAYGDAFTPEALTELHAGTVTDMWMPPIKTHCFVIYETVTAAHDAYLGTYNLVWPRSGKQLLPKFVAVEEAKSAIEEGRSKALYARASGSSSYQKRSTPYAPPARVQSEETGSRTSRPATKPPLSLEDLFFKTQAKPPIYYLPLTDEQVAERKRSSKEKDTSQTTQEGQKDV